MGWVFFGQGERKKTNTRTRTDKKTPKKWVERATKKEGKGTLIGKVLHKRKEEEKTAFFPIPVLPTLRRNASQIVLVK